MQKQIPVLIADDWQDYALLDSGDGEKLEQFAGYTIARPDPRALWHKRSPDLWSNADALYVRDSDTSGQWRIQKDPPTDWRVHYDDVTLTLKPTTFKHVGVFPEQAPNWRWIVSRIHKPCTVLNLFGYTGAATLFAAKAGATVTHVDASKPSISWAKANAEASGLSTKPIRWILDDAYKFVIREARRKASYDGIIMDPPRFGRGAKGEVWKLETDLPKLIAACKDILSPQPAFFLLNAYTADLSSIAISQLVDDLTRPFGGTMESGELALRDTNDRLLPNGIFSRWSGV